MTVKKITNLPLKKILSRALRNGGQFADLFYESREETRLVLENNRLEKVITGTDRGAGLRVIDHLHATMPIPIS